ncbi:hypothetical protein BURCENBC7_AP2416 [Burkholderia cenocepacia BC7]|jgi:hypothetical protein|nr:hypothetical protein BURCENK562V_C3911 [Burkholderia cenocepacia K56-2Valvano]ERI28960.1 hypothetical protein BURCENBC7_AP2416 [Burkholderia cenocepacia BC7]CDN63495.1 hypothetical protein I35_5659 [Burkholderia cenocepacia H111]
MVDHGRTSTGEPVMQIDSSWGVSFKIALHLLFLCIGVAWAGAELVAWWR